MIIRKPYAFLIKNFRKIHIVLLLLSLYVAYRIINVNHFVNQFMKLGTYDLYADPVTNHITGFMMISIFIIFIGSCALLFLLKHKGKPWRTYLVPIVFYVSLYFVLGMIKSFFKTYTIDVETTDLRMARDLLMIFVVLQIPAIGVFLMRILGVDIGKFNFNTDQEFLELSEADREEVEISLDFDINSLKRFYKRTIRNINYFYREHKGLCRLIVFVLFIGIAYKTYTFIFVTNKVYKTGDYYNYNGFTVKINNAYVTDKDYKNEVISHDSKFIILNLDVKNNADDSRKFDTSNFHIKAGNLDYSTTETVFAKEFSDLGNAFSKVKSINGGQKNNFIIIYKVNKKISNRKFVLYFQEKDGISKLRKIKLDLQDIGVLEDAKRLQFGDVLTVSTYKGEENISFDDFKLTDSIDYSVKKCSVGNCSLSSNFYRIEEGYKIMTIEFGSDTFESKNMIDFFDMYGKINYKDSSGDDSTIDIDFALKNKYYGKLIYLKVPNEIEDAKEVALDFIIRNKEYIYKLT